MSYVAEAMHVAIYGIAFDERLSARASVALPVALLALSLGGLAMGLFEFWRRRFKLGGSSIRSRPTRCAAAGFPCATG